MMIYSKKKTVLNHNLFWISHLAVAVVLMLWFNPLTQPLCQRIDTALFQVLNGSLTTNPLWQQLWGLLNHKYEARLNLLIAALVNLVAILATKDHKTRMVRIKQTLYFWLCFQIGFMVQDHLFHTIFHIKRESPSITLQPVVKLALLLQNSNIKDFSYHSFPSGHAFAMIYWAAFTFFCAPKKIAWFGIIMAVILSFARLFSGAHWFSDTLFAALLALVWLSWTMHTPIYAAIMAPLPVALTRHSR